MIFCMGCSFERKKVIQLLMILYFDCKLNNLWVDKGNKFDNKSIKSWLQDKDIETYSVHNEEKPVFAERFIRTLKSKIYKHTTSILKSVNINKIDNLVDKYNNTYYRTIKMKPIGIKTNTHIDFDVENNGEDPKFKIGSHIKISKYGYTPDW